jgi:hypothetical protein
VAGRSTEVVLRPKVVAQSSGAPMTWSLTVRFLGALSATSSICALTMPMMTATAPADAMAHGMDCCHARTTAAARSARPQVMVLKVRVMRLSVALPTDVR